MSSPLPPDPYAALGIAKDASLATIRSAHRKLVLKCHPDKIQDEALRAQKQNEFHLIQQAYEILSDDQKRSHYNDQLKLAELKREQLERNGRGARIEIRTASPQTLFETRRAQRSYGEPRTRSYEEDMASSTFHEEPRASSRKYDGYEPSVKRPSTRGYDERRATAAAADEHERARLEKDRAREYERSSHSDRRRTRDKDRRRGHDEKHHRAYIEDDDDYSDDYSSRVEAGIRRRNEEARMKERFNEATPRRSLPSRKEDDFYDDRERKIHSHVSSAQDYIERSRTGSETHSRPPVSYRAPSFQSPQYESVQSSPRPESSVRRSSARARERTRESSRTRSSGKDRKGSIEIVEPPRNHDRKKPGLPHSASSPSHIKLPAKPISTPPSHRSATMDYSRDRQGIPSMLRRSETSPLVDTPSRKAPPQPSKLNTKGETHDSGYSSPGTPEGYNATEPLPQPRATRYMVVPEDEQVEFSRGHRTILVDPDDEQRQRRSPSPFSHRTLERPPFPRGSTSSARYAPQSRSTHPQPSEATPSRQPPPLLRSETARPSMPRMETGRSQTPLTRTESFRPPPIVRTETSRQLPTLSRNDSSSGILYGEVRYAKNYAPEDIRYSPGYEGRRESRDAETSPRDAYPRSYYSDMHRHPGLPRAETMGY
ncbi:MAG: hypothetical protein M1835_002822 [Candelina submexicana]|nr:MAG: hypothetical protein M1835_002822 [Candelina submexicana]